MKTSAILFAAAATLALAPVTAHAQNERVFDYFEAVESGDTATISATSQALINGSAADAALNADDFYELLIQIGDARADANNLDGAIAAYEKAVGFAETTYGNDAFQLRPALQALGAAYAKKGDFEEAEAILLRSLQIAESTLGERNPSLREELDLLASLPIPPLEDKSGPDGGDRAGAYRRRELLLAQSARLRRGEIVTLGGSDENVVDQCNDVTKKDKAYKRLEVFYGTNRKISGKTTPEKFYANEFDQNSGVKYGAVYVTVPCNRALGRIPRAKLWKGDFRQKAGKHLVLEDIREIDDADGFWSDVATNITKSERKEALVFIHGFNVPFSGAALRTAQLAADLELDGAPLFYDWPSRASLFAYQADRDIATSQTIINDVAAFLHDVVERTGAERVSIIAHSMGNEPLLRALEELEDNQFKDETKKPFDEVIFASPDVMVANFRTLVNDTQRLAKRMTLYASSKDKALDISRWKAKFTRAGDAKEKIVIDGLDSVDTTLASSNFVGHNDFAGNGLDDLRAIVWHSLTPGNRCVLNEGGGEAEGIWIFKPKCEDNIFKAAIVSLRRLGRTDALALADAQIQRSIDESDGKQEANWRAVKSELESFGR